MVEGARSIEMPTFDNNNGRLMEYGGGASIIDGNVRDGKRQSDVFERAFQFVDESSEMVWESSNSLAEKYPSPALFMDRAESQ
jgi:hypothetical protein